ncbi:transmembrane protein, putative [Bodo saltans]|uniref:Transmembrane protein, putative n=1 Tax=Bodo saltans TaxID=75058 RepID=A0A0S4IJJ8_BODSA|nr:transmembrane protein, putative [Bodo saltans]|eukprot:CUE88060.1 transmembrane protein, putative [Bodo saltans]
MASPSHREHDVKVLQDAAQSVRSLRKDVDAQWVAGLRPEDELAELQHAAFRRREAAQAERQQQQRARRRAVSASKPLWLRWPLLFGVLWVIALWVRALDMWPGDVSLGTVLQAEYPPYEFHLWNVIRNAMTTSSPLVALVVPSVGVTTLASLFAATAAFQFGAATQDFLCFCGFGFSTLSLFSGLSTGAVLLTGCPTVEAECFTPLVATWVSSLMRWVMPWLALWPIAALWDGLNVRRGASLLFAYRWRLLASLPLIGYTAVVASTKWVCYRTDMTVCGAPSPVTYSTLLAGLPSDPETFRHYGLLQLGFETTELVGAVVATLILVRLSLQKAIGLVPIQQGEDDADALPALMPPPSAAPPTGKNKTE